jgi:hypothetical protein
MTICFSLADYLDKDMPELPVEEDTPTGVSLIKAGGRDEDEAVGRRLLGNNRLVNMSCIRI